MTVKLSQIIKYSTPLRSEAEADASVQTECLFGESVEIIEIKDNFSYCSCIIDNYKGWILSEDLGKFLPTSHIVSSVRTFIQKEPDVKSSIIFSLPFAAQITATNTVNQWLEIVIKDQFSGFIPLKHISKIDENHIDWVSTAEKLINTPYKWGGRDCLGIDCSALIQLSLQLSGISFPRDTIEQEKVNWQIINKKSLLTRGSLVFWKGHVGVMLDKENILHANASSMCVNIERLDVVEGRHHQQNLGSITKMMKL